MSRLIAECVMRGRLQAIIVALLGAWVPFLSQASLGLVSLRRGWADGLLISFWAAVPVLGVIWFGDTMYTLTCIGVGVILVTYVAACFLRVSVSLPYSLWVGAGLGVAISIMCYVLLAGVINEEFTDFLERVLSEQKKLHQDGSPTIDLLSEISQSWNSVKSFGFIALAVTFSGLVGLLFSRWWQALLFNPGGFQQEFHGLSLSVSEALGALVLIGFMASLGQSYYFWLASLALPLVFVGLGIVHCMLKPKPFGTVCLVMVYFAVLVAPTVNILLAAIAISDVWLNYRKKFNT